MGSLKIVDDGLVSKKEWDAQIDSLKNCYGSGNVEAIKKDIVNAVNGLPDKFALLFSGGIDSTLIAFTAKALGKEFVCYSFGIKGARDLEWSKKAEERFGFNVEYVEYGLDEFEKVIVETAKLIGEVDAIKVSIGAVFYPVLEKAKKDGFEFVVTGLGSEEIFAGYERHSSSTDVNEECWKGLYTIFERDFTRDVKLAENFGLELRLPFLDKTLVMDAMALPSEMKINKGYKKYALRLAAEELGLLKEFCWRKKKAAQYGSKSNRAFLKVAKRNGFDKRKEFVRDILKK